MEHTKTRMEETLTREQKIVFIKSNGWFSMWSEDNWLTSREGNHDWGGRSLESAYQQCIEDIEDVELEKTKTNKQLYIEL
jgi:hypothetical protein